MASSTTTILAAFMVIGLIASILFATLLKKMWPLYNCCQLILLWLVMDL